MLAELHIQNIAVIQKAAILLKDGLNVFTGETGAGKTILITALDAVLGERTSRDIIRFGEEKAQVSALFENISFGAKKAFESMGYKIEDDTVLVFREISAGGKNACRINGMPANVGILKDLCSRLISIHGQRDTGQLISPEEHLRMIDEYGELQPSLSAYGVELKKLNFIKKTLSEVGMDEAQKNQRIDMLRYQIAEIEEANLDNPQLEENLIAERRIISGSEKIRKNLSDAVNAYYGSAENTGIDQIFSQFKSSVESAGEYLEDLQETVERLGEMEYELSDMGREIRSRLETLEFDPAYLDQLESRLNTIYNLKRKYGNSVADILQYYASATEELDQIVFSDERKDKLEKELTTQTQICDELAKKLSKKRAIACKKFIGLVEGELAFLDMPNVKLSVAHATIPFSSKGTDSLEFMIVTNLGEQPKPLGKIASGGELARIMLAIKNVLADKDNIDTLIFDEIDTGVSGKAAGKIGRKLHEVSVSRQVVCVTHLAQVAAFADNHLYIHKETDGERTFTKIDMVDGEESVKELARITSGEVITPAALESARELIGRAKQPYRE